MGGWWSWRVAVITNAVRPLISRPGPTLLCATGVQVTAVVVASIIEPTSTFSTCREVVVLAAIGAAAAQGYRVGLVSMAIGSAVFVAFIEGSARSLATTPTFLPLPVATVAVVLTAAVRVQLRARSSALRHQEKASLELAASQRAALDAIIVRTESFLDGRAVQPTLDAIVQTAKESFAGDLAVLWRIEDGLAEAVAATMERTRFVVVPGDDPLVHPDIARGIRPVFLPLSGTEAPFRLDRPLLALGMHSALKIPVLSHGTTMILTVAFRESRASASHNELLVAQRFGAQAAVAIEQAEAAEAQREVDDLHARLEAGLLPRVAVERSDVAASVLYLPGEDRLLVGGDFLDVLDLPDGRVGVIVGDVAGHGASAAALGAVLRAGWRTLVLAGTDPPEVMETLNSLTLVERDTPEIFVTAVCAWIDPAAPAVDLCLAGHPPPIAAGGEVRLLEAAVCPPLGAREQTAWTVERKALDDPWSLVFMTDGVPEARRSAESDERIGLEGVVRWLASRAGGGRIDAGVIDDLLLYAETQNGGTLSDDVTVVSVRSTSPASAERSGTTTLTAAPGS